MSSDDLHHREHDSLEQKIYGVEQRILGVEKDILSAVTSIGNNVRSQIDQLLREIQGIHQRLDKSDDQNREVRDRTIRAEEQNKNLEKRLDAFERSQDEKIKESTEKALNKTKIWVYTLLFTGISIMISALIKKGV